VRSWYPWFLVASLTSLEAAALDKQGSAHGGSVTGADSGFNVSGAASLGVSLFNPSYAARPDNTGLALMRYALHLDLDLIGRRLSLPLDVNLFSDRERKGGRKLLPTEFDVIGGVTSTWALGPGALELGARAEHDRPIDRGTFSQTYGDLRARWLYSVAEVSPAVKDALRDGDLSGWFTLGVFAINPSYAARPDNTGLALMRYGVHGEVSLWGDLISFAVDTTLFSDRQRRGMGKLAPSELDVTPEIIGRIAPWELHLAYERDLPLDRSGLVQSFVYALLVYSFDMQQSTPAPLGLRNQIPSP
jgi:hypothetical protein